MEKYGKVIYIIIYLSTLHIIYKTSIRWTKQNILYSTYHSIVIYGSYEFIFCKTYLSGAACTVLFSPQNSSHIDCLCCTVDVCKEQGTEDNQPQQCVPQIPDCWLCKYALVYVFCKYIYVRVYTLVKLHRINKDEWGIVIAMSAWSGFPYQWTYEALLTAACPFHLIGYIITNVFWTWHIWAVLDASVSLLVKFRGQKWYVLFNESKHHACHLAL